MIQETFREYGDKIYRNLSLNMLGGLTSIASPPAIRGEPESLGFMRSYLRGERPSYESHVGISIKVIDLFCGCGGLSLGVRDAIRAIGCEERILAAVDIDQDVLRIYEANLSPRLALRENVNSLVDFQLRGQGDDVSFAYRPEMINSEIAKHENSVDILIAGPPCQGHSNLNNYTRREDPRNYLYLGVVAIAVSLNTASVIIENVPSIVNDKERVVDTAKTLLLKNDYFVSDGIIDAQHLGCAQTRKRHFLIASKSPLDSIVYLVEPFKKPVVPLSWAVGDLLESDGISHFDTAPLLSETNIKRIEFMFENDLFNLPDDRRPECHQNGHTYPSVYGRLGWDRPSGTITTGFLTPGRGRFIHPLRKRVLTPHEAVRIQGFPDSFTFVPSKKHSSPRNLLTKSIGGAVPPVMGYVTGSCVLASLSEIILDGGKRAQTEE